MASYVPVNGEQIRILHEEDVCQLMTLMQSFSDHWLEIGMALGFTPPELNQIRKNPMLLTTAPKSFLTELLSLWIQWPTVDHPTKPTLEALCEALRSSLVGLGQLAEEVEREMKYTTTGKEGHIQRSLCRVTAILKHDMIVHTLCPGVRINACAVTQIYM